MGSQAIKESKNELIGEKHLIKKIGSGKREGGVGGGQIETGGENKEVGGVTFEFLPVAAGGESVFGGVDFTAPFFGMVRFVEENDIAVLGGPGKGVEKGSPVFCLIKRGFLPETTLIGGGEPDNGNEFKEGKLIESVCPASLIALVFADDKSNVTPLAAGAIDKGGGGFEVVFIEDVNTDAVIGDNEGISDGTG